MFINTNTTETPVQTFRFLLGSDHSEEVLHVSIIFAPTHHIRNKIYGTTHSLSPPIRPRRSFLHILLHK